MSYIVERQRLRAPRVWLLPVLAISVAAITLPMYPDDWSFWERNLGVYLTLVWTFPAVMSMVAAVGGVLAWLSVTLSQRDRARTARSDAFLVIQVPTIGRHDVMPALTRSVESYVESAPAGFDNWRVDVVAEETSEAREALDALASHRVRVLYVPTAYATPNGTERKARANHWTDALRRYEGELRPDIWVLHMDDDTGIAPDTVLEIARFIEDNPADDPDAKVLAQGVLTYPRSYAKKLMVWVADSIRPSSDLSFFRAATGSGLPLFGAHGELLLIRADIESTIAWDFGRLLSITEDANFALTFAHRYPGRSGWFPGRCFGSAPESFSDLVTQRKRWCRGLLHVVTNRELPLRIRVVLGYGIASWVLGPFQHVIVILTIAMVFQLRYTAPLQPWLLVPWAVHTSIGLWMYLEGMRANRDVSHPDDRRWWHYLLLLSYPVLMLIEAWAALKGFVAFVKDRMGRNDAELFEVIRKTHVDKVDPKLVGAGSGSGRTTT